MNDEELQCIQLFLPGARAMIGDVRRRLAVFPEIDSVLLTPRPGVLEIYFTGGAARLREWRAALLDASPLVDDPPPAA